MHTRISRRAMLGASALSAADSAPAGSRPACNVISEWAFTSEKSYINPFHDVDVDAVFEGPGGRSWRVPAFWAGNRTWKLRFAPPEVGAYRFQTFATDPGNSSLHGRGGNFETVEYVGENSLFKHGPVRLDSDRKHFQHADGTPFFLLADDWWHGMTSRLRWPHEFNLLAEDRRRKGYTVIKLTAGLNCDVPHFDPRNHNEAGHCYEPAYSSIRPRFFDLADQRVERLVSLGLVPCIVGAWGYYLASMGVERMKKHWRYLVARWGAYPVIWQLTMEHDMVYYMDRDEGNLADLQRRGWAETGRRLKETDPFGRLITMQPSGTTMISRKGLPDALFLDYDSLQCGHNDYESFLRMVRALEEARRLQPAMPALAGEVCFEGIGWQNWQNIQRRVFWGSVLNGAPGFCYGANGIWQFNRKEAPFGASPHGRTWGGDAWEVAAQYPGCRQIGLGKKLLTRFPFWRLEPHPEWVRSRPLGDGGDYRPPYAAGIPGQLRIAYFENTWAQGVTVRLLEAGARYRAFWFDPVLGEDHPIGAAEAGSNGEWTSPPLPRIHDHVLVLVKA